jgi:hypothetical protein
MKILIFHRTLNGEHPWIRGLRTRGMGVLTTNSILQVPKILALHGSSIDLAVFEHAADNKLEVEACLRTLKRDPLQSDLPTVVVTQVWGDLECADHQNSPSGANAYLQVQGDQTSLTQLGRDITERLERLLIEVLGESRWSGKESELPPPLQSGKSEVSILMEIPVQMKEGPPEVNSGEGPISIDLSDSPTSEPVQPTVSLSNSSFSEGEISIVEMESEVSPLAPTQSLAMDQLPLESARELPPELPVASEESVGLETPTGSPDLHEDSEVRREMPYLLGKKRKSVSPFTVAGPRIETLVPGGISQSPDVDTLKNYLYLREQDVVVLASQLKAAKEQIAHLEEELRVERTQRIEAEGREESWKRRLDESEVQRQAIMDGVRVETGDLRFELKKKADQIRMLEAQARTAVDETERLKERVRSDIRKIRVREKELENRLEILKKDSESLISSREQKILELKRKMDLLEFNIDLLQDHYAREKERSHELETKLAKVGQVVRVVGGLIDPQEKRALNQALEGTEVDSSGDVA